LNEDRAGASRSRYSVRPAQLPTSSASRNVKFHIKRLSAMFDKMAVDSGSFPFAGATYGIEFPPPVSA